MTTYDIEELSTEIVTVWIRISTLHRRRSSASGIAATRHMRSTKFCLLDANGNSCDNPHDTQQDPGSKGEIPIPAKPYKRKYTKSASPLDCVLGEKDSDLPDSRTMKVLVVMGGGKRCSWANLVSNTEGLVSGAAEVGILISCPCDPRSSCCTGAQSNKGAKEMDHLQRRGGI